MAEGARLESVYTATYREFESLSHRQFLKFNYIKNLNQKSYSLDFQNFMKYAQSALELDGSSYARQTNLNNPINFFIHPTSSYRTVIKLELSIPNTHVTSFSLVGQPLAFDC